MVDAHDGLFDCNEVAQERLQSIDVNDTYEDVQGSEREPLSDPDGTNTSMETFPFPPMREAHTCDFHEVNVMSSEQRL